MWYGQKDAMNEIYVMYEMIMFFNRNHDLHVDEYDNRQDP